MVFYFQFEWMLVWNFLGVDSYFVCFCGKGNEKLS